MAVPPFILELRKKIGHDMLWLPGITFVILRRTLGEEGSSGPSTDTASEPGESRLLTAGEPRAPQDASSSEHAEGDCATDSSNHRIEVLLVQRSDNGTWTPITGIVDPGEEPAVAAVREAWEEARVKASIRALQRVQVVGPVVYPNGDQTCYVDTALWGTPADDFHGEATVGDDESVAVQWTDVTTLDALDPPMNPRFTHLIADAVLDFESGTIAPAAWGPHTSPRGCGSQ